MTGTRDPLAAPLRAQLSLRGGRDWHLYVCTDRWPVHTFGRVLPVPTRTERSAALAALGFEPLPGAEWSWSEDAEDWRDAGSPVLLIAALAVRPLTGGAA
ncbi:DUF6303 family protein [Streptomyces sp. NPDC085927]|uniref:DUF6303 family protein n=1 Tax=Streptomyces sp. NPDC085927 TaxID=3365738 RepID=UPI0037CF6223